MTSTQLNSCMLYYIDEGARLRRLWDGGVLWCDGLNVSRVIRFLRTCTLYQSAPTIMSSLYVLCTLSALLGITSFVVGILPLSFTFSSEYPAKSWTPPVLTRIG